MDLFVFRIKVKGKLDQLVGKNMVFFLWNG